MVPPGGFSLFRGYVYRSAWVYVHASLAVMNQGGPVPITQLWLSELPESSASRDLRCPGCGGSKFTVARADYGIELACFTCPTFIGIPTIRE